MVLGPCPCRGFWRESPTYVGDGQDIWPGYMCLLAKKRKGLKSFLAESREKNWNYLFYPSAKSRRELKIKTLGVTFRGASAYYVQKSIAPQKQAVCRFSDEIFFWRKFSSKNFAKKFFRRRKMKCWESSETRFPKVWGRTEPSSRGKRPVKVLQKFGGNFSFSAEIWCYHPGPRVSKLAKMTAYFL